MTVAAFVLSIVATVVALVSLTWNVVESLRQGPRPRLTPVIGISTPGGLVINDATRDARESIRQATAQLPDAQMVIGVQVVNVGRAPFHVAGWSVRCEPTATALVPIDNEIGSPKVPCEIPPGAEMLFYTGLASARAVMSESADGEQQQVVLAVSSGGRMFRSRPIVPELLTFDPPEPRPPSTANSGGTTD